VSAINGDRRGQPIGSGGAWCDATPNVFPDTLDVTFNGSKTISEIDLFSLQDNVQNPTDPTPSMTFNNNGVRSFEAQYWNGSAWQTIPGATVAGNNLVWRQVPFAPITTSKIRIQITQSAFAYSCVAEVEAWGTSAASVGSTAAPGHR
jgi:hypothetical protein